MSVALGWTGRVLGFASVVAALILSLPGIHAARADDPAPQASETAPPNASFEGFARHLEKSGRVVPVETAGPTCSAPTPTAVEMAHRRAIVAMQARMIADARAHAADGEAPSDVVVLNGRGYNYRNPEPGGRAAAPPSADAR